MMKPCILLLLLFILAKNGYTQQTTYKTGDTLTVFTIGGLKLRAEASLSGSVLASMKLGEKVVVSGVFQTDKSNFQTIEGFGGHWVKVRYDTLEGFAFDGFLSSLPLPGENLLPKDYQKKNIGYEGQEMDDALWAYIQTEFHTIGEPVEYYNGYEGEGFAQITLQKLSRGFTFINLGGWEGWNSELLMPGVRLSEIKNLIILLAYRSGLANKHFEELKSVVKKIQEEQKPLQEILHLDMFQIMLKHYPVEHNELKWTIVFVCASS